MTIHVKSYQHYYRIAYSLYITPCKTMTLRADLCCIANIDWCSSIVFCISSSCYLGKSQDGQYLRPSDPAYEQVLDSLAMISRHTPVPLLEALLRWRERWAKSPFFFFLPLIFFFLGFLILLIRFMLLTFILYIIKGQEWHLTFPLLPSLNSFPNEPNLHSLLHTTPCDSLSWWIQFESLLLVYSLHM